MSLARASRPAAVKKLVGLSSALLTFLPVARRSCVVESRLAVPCKESRFWRTAAERVTLFKAMGVTFLVYATDGLLGRTRRPYEANDQRNLNLPWRMSRYRPASRLMLYNV